jgi:hypothetical protein
MNLEEHTKAKFVLDHFTRLKNGLADARFDVSITGINILSSELIELKKLDDKAVLGKELSERLNSAMTNFEKIVFAESSTKHIFLLPQRRYNSDYLLNSPRNLFSKDLFLKITDLAIYDINSACRCLLFGEGTAAAFHMLRATEEVLKQYYRKHKKTKRLAKPMWGSMTQELRSKRANRPPDIVLNSLDLVRTSYRNPTQHPDLIYDIESAQDLFGLCIDLINKMASEFEINL